MQGVSAGLSDIDIPTPVLSGNHDRVEPPDVLADHQLPLLTHGIMSVLEDTGHITTFTAQLRRRALRSRWQTQEGDGHG
ncbi:hypothetical protein [Mycobacterium sp.]|uniref:hypothetical protein n=1 Tax=Mycobacterium sp. TaxID=1785 RepID=UPI002D532C82|nr:hypothetical protein [Mycobacterium sp.]HZA09085.1 hypothetical protein [Mycobacterium sp.]